MIPRGLRDALGLLTVVPVSRLDDLDRDRARTAMAWAPAVGLGVAAVASAVLLAARVLLASPDRGPSGSGTPVETAGLAAVLAFATLAVLTGGLHLDGLADTVDALASRAPRERVLQIMEEGSVGPLGVVALIFVLAADVAALTVAVRAHHGTQSLVVAVTAGRVAMLWGTVRGTPAARPTGLGALVAGVTGRTTAVAWTTALLVGAGAFGYVDPGAASPAWALRAVVGVLVALAVGVFVRGYAIRRLGGITGDVLGAIGELATLAALLVLDIRRL
ncbi:MAG: adenosylcobinamide-GDP ribazoletransferase [Acidothermus sp.]|nr:adenosylcobinamide-GDP ribazoletransferase [Acidothermus sp.]MCL6537666.1 adenosylcobinamide-GDP ribazoletransferase [Acidothermus sp.]